MSGSAANRRSSKPGGTCVRSCDSSGESGAWYFGGGLALALAIFGGVILLQIATQGLPPGDGHAETHPAVFPGVPAKPAPSTGGGH